MDKLELTSLGEFKNPQLESFFRKETWHKETMPLIIFTIFTIFSAFAVDIKKIILFNFNYDFLILLSLKTSIFIFGITLILFALSESGIKRVPIISTLFLIIVSLYITCESIVKSLETNVCLAALIFVIIVLYCLANFQLISAAAGGILASLIYCLGVWYATNISFNDIIFTILICITANIFGIIIFKKTSELKRNNFLTQTNMTSLQKELLKEKNHKETIEKKLKHLQYQEELKSKNDTKTDGFALELISEYNRSVRYGSDLAVLFLAINNFEKILSKLGKKSTDHIVHDLNKVFNSEIRPAGDFFIQAEDNKFAFILPSTDEYGALSFADRIRENIMRRIYKIKEIKIQLSVSIGIACLNQEKDPLELIKKAEQAITLSTRGNNNMFVLN